MNTPAGSHGEIVGYCTNVHPGRDFEQVLENIVKFGVPVRNALTSSSSLGIGLWFSEGAAAQAIAGSKLAALKNELERLQLVPYTLNGFPQGDFHTAVVKHRVYLPTWWESSRLEYTSQLIHVLDSLLPADRVGSISTLPIAWCNPIPTREQLAQAANNFLSIAHQLDDLYSASGRRIVLAIEPEPGCYLTDTRSLRRFFDEYLSSPRISENEAAVAREYLTICHDICHAAVMYEDQSQELAALSESGIGIGKVQVSSAIQVNWDSLSQDDRVAAFHQLSGFAEDRYLHQTHIIAGDHTRRLVEDLPPLLNSIVSPESLSGEWRIHFHVPIYLGRMGQLGSTQNQIRRCLQLLQNPSPQSVRFTGHYEVETYAWGVLPEPLRVENLSQGIANEVQWLLQEMAETNSFSPRP